MDYNAKKRIATVTTILALTVPCAKMSLVLETTLVSANLVILEPSVTSVWTLVRPAPASMELFAKANNREDSTASVPMDGKEHSATLTLMTALKNLVSLEQIVPTWSMTLLAIVLTDLAANAAKIRWTSARHPTVSMEPALTSYLDTSKSTFFT